VPSFRTDITADIVKQAAAMARAAENSTAITDWFDVRQHYLQLRQRGRQVTWYVRARGRSQKIGVANSLRGEYERNYLSIKQARDRAAGVYAGIEAHLPKPESSEPGVATAWTWADCDREYQASLKETRWVGGAAGRERPPSRWTQDDVRLAFAKPAMLALHCRPLTDLQPLEIVRAIDDVHAASGHRAACKSLTYIKSALTWAANKKGSQSGLYGATAWWQTIRPPDPTATEIGRIRQRRSTLAQAKVAFTVDHLGALLVEHEAYCAAERVSPGIRWGLWWVAYTANRRQSTVALERSRLLQTDEFGRAGWGRAMWSLETMKGRAEFWLPLPPAVLDVANGSISDWHRTIRRSHGQITTRWVFSSTRRHGRDPENDDVAVYPNSLNAHLRCLRGDKGRTRENLIESLPWFSLHLVRAVSGNYLDGAATVPKAAISAMLAHADGTAEDRLAPTTKAFYVQNQKMGLKAQAMEAWSDAVLNAYVKAGGKPPAPSEDRA
jgi:hypothetical protein